MVPSEADIRKLQARIGKVQASLVEGKLPEKMQMQMLRNAIRQVWMRHPVKLLKLDMAKIADNNPDTRRKWAVECEHYERIVNLNFAEVDHKNGHHSLKEVEELIEFYERILDVTLDDLQVLCKTCHGIKTYADGHGLSLPEAAAVKAAIKWSGTTSKEAMQKALINSGCAADIKDVSSKKKCRDIAEQLFSGIVGASDTVPPQLTVYDLLEGQ